MPSCKYVTLVVDPQERPFAEEETLVTYALRMMREHGATSHEVEDITVSLTKIRPRVYTERFSISYIECE